MNSYEKAFIGFLKKKGLKLTNPRRIILEAVFSNHGHFDIETLYDQIRKEHKGVSRATIYRTVPLMVEAGLIKKPLRQDSKDHYEHSYRHRNHLHLICSECGRIIEATSKQVEERLLQISKKYNFGIEEYNLTVSGICKNCQKKS
jgi:Fur family transcriptional regulator, ferric uptake regulator